MRLPRKQHVMAGKDRWRHVLFSRTMVERQQLQEWRSLVLVVGDQRDRTNIHIIKRRAKSRAKIQKCITIEPDSQLLTAHTPALSTLILLLADGAAAGLLLDGPKEGLESVGLLGLRVPVDRQHCRPLVPAASAREGRQQAGQTSSEVDECTRRSRRVATLEALCEAVRRREGSVHER